LTKTKQKKNKMASDDTFDDEFQLVNDFENLNNDEVCDKDREDDCNDDGNIGENEIQEEQEDEINMSQINALKKEELLKLQQNKQNLKEEYDNINNIKTELQTKLREQNEIVEKKSTGIKYIKTTNN